MTLVNIVPYVILHQKTHVPWAVNFFESQKASEHPVTYCIYNHNVYLPPLNWNYFQNYDCGNCKDRMSRSANQKSDGKVQIVVCN